MAGADTMPHTIASIGRWNVATDFRRQILDRLKKLDKSKYWLSEQLGDALSPNALYTYLREGSKTDMGGTNIAKIIDILDAEERRQNRQ
jgi:hypothetical protein